MTDEESICGWMEPRPELPMYWAGQYNSSGGWWTIGTINGGGMQWFACRNGHTLDLDALHEVEARLTDEQWHRYKATLYGECHQAHPRAGGVPSVQDLIHLSAEQKIKALAAVLR